MKKRILILILLSFYLFLFSCTSPEKKFKEAEMNNTVESFQNFLKEFPESKFSAMAKNKIDSLAYENTLRENSEKSFFLYFETYPDSKYAQESLSKAAFLAYEKVIDENTESTYLEFVKKYPNSEFSEKAKNKAALLSFENASKEYTIEGFQKFISDYPESEFIDKAKNIIEDIQNGCRYWNENEFAEKIRNVNTDDFSALKKYKFIIIDGGNQHIWDKPDIRNGSLVFFDFKKQGITEVTSAHLIITLFKEGFEKNNKTGIGEIFFWNRSIRVFFIDGDISGKLQKKLHEQHLAKYKKHIKNRRAQFSILCTYADN